MDRENRIGDLEAVKVVRTLARTGNVSVTVHAAEALARVMGGGPDWILRRAAEGFITGPETLDPIKKGVARETLKLALDTRNLCLRGEG